MKNLYFYRTEDLDLGNTPQEISQLKHGHLKWKEWFYLYQII